MDPTGPREPELHKGEDDKSEPTAESVPMMEPTGTEQAELHTGKDEEPAAGSASDLMKPTQSHETGLQVEPAGQEVPAAGAEPGLMPTPESGDVAFPTGEDGKPAIRADAVMLEPTESGTGDLPGATREESLPTASGDESAAAPDAVPSEDRGLPGIKELEANLSPEMEDGTQFLSILVEVLEEDDPDAPSYGTLDDEQKELAAALAEVVSGGATDKLIGLRIPLKDITPFDGPSADNEATGVLTVTRFLGSGASNIVLEVMDEVTEEVYALRVYSQAAREPKERLEAVAKAGRDALASEERSARMASGNTPTGLAATHKGIALPLCTPVIAGTYEVTLAGTLFIFNRVQLMDRLHGDLHGLMPILQRKYKDHKGVQHYIARRLLLEALHLQQAGVSHNDLKWSNLFMQSDGLFALGDFGSSSSFGEPMYTMTEIARKFRDLFRSGDS